MIKRTKKQEGVTLIVLVIAVVLMLLIAGTLVYNSRTNVDIKRLNALYNDIELLQNEVQEYYLENKKIPILRKYTGLGQIDNRNPNDDAEGYYVLDISKLGDVRLNYGRDFETVRNESAGDPSNYEDVYIINIQSHTIYYPKGVEVEGIKYYTLQESYTKVERGSLPSTEETKPYYPDNTFFGVPGTDLETGLVVSNGEDEYVWIEVPISVTKSATTEEQIESALRNYAATYLVGYTDSWYDANGNVEGTVGVNTSDTTGCGMTLTVYKDTKSKILQGIKANGGFWMGRYEMGTEERRVQSSTAITGNSAKATSSPDKYVYNWITCSEAQYLASKMAEGKSYDSSLMLGLQWALACKYIEIKAPKAQDDLNKDSTGWGNYKNASFLLNRGRYSKDGGATYQEVQNLTSRTKTKEEEWILTTGASERNKILNIYDFAGNIAEYTLEKASNTAQPTVASSGQFASSTEKRYASVRDTMSTTARSVNVGARNVLY